MRSWFFCWLNHGWFYSLVLGVWLPVVGFCLCVVVVVVVVVVAAAAAAAVVVVAAAAVVAAAVVVVLLFFVLDTDVIITGKSTQHSPHLSHWPQHRRIQRQQPCDAPSSVKPCGSTNAWTPRSSLIHSFSLKRKRGQKKKYAII